jgi:ubiquinone/menaquinone biosynthesis C-methylase UbiE
MSKNFGAAADDYAKFRAGFPDSFFDRLASSGLRGSGITVVDVGTGTGTLARGFARRGAAVIAIDPDDRLVQQARRLDAAASVSIEYKMGTAEQIPLPNGVADVVTAGQCWHWFDGARAAKEFARIAKPDGRVVVAHFDWLPLPGNVVEATERLIKQHNTSWHFDGGNGFHPESVPYLYAAGFREFETFSYDLEVPYTPEAWRGRIRASAGVGASLEPTKIQIFDTALARILDESFPGEMLQVAHRVFAVLARSG